MDALWGAGRVKCSPQPRLHRKEPGALTGRVAAGEALPALGHSAAVSGAQQLGVGPAVREAAVEEVRPWPAMGK